MYPLHSAQLRLAVLRLAANRAVDEAMKTLHWRAGWGPFMDKDDLAEAAQRFHERMKVDESNCRWCGLAQREALEELEGDDG